MRAFYLLVKLRLLDTKEIDRYPANGFRIVRNGAN